MIQLVENPEFEIEVGGRRLDATILDGDFDSRGEVNIYADDEDALLLEDVFWKAAREARTPQERQFVVQIYRKSDQTSRRFVSTAYLMNFAPVGIDAQVNIHMFGRLW